jgi:uncharacterized damage-inducible protein DinB
MNDDFASLFAYNRWAERKFLDVCRKLTPQQFTAEPVPGWSSIQSTMAHVAISTEGWIRGLAGETVEGSPSEDDLPTVADIEAHLDQAYKILDKVLASLSAVQLDTPRVFEGGDQRAILPPWAVLRHLVNHATYHRGQVASKLKRLGVEPPATDLVIWAFERFPQQF